MDRRIQKTKQAIMNTLIELMSEKDFEKITINDIADHANVNRGTIYLHYTDKYDLLDKCIETYLSQLADYCTPESSITDNHAKASMLKTFEYLEQNALLYKTLLTNKSVPTFRNKLMEFMLTGLEQQLIMNDINHDIPKDILTQFLVSAAVGVLEWWFVSTAPYSAKDITEHLWLLMEHNQIILNTSF